MRGGVEDSGPDPGQVGRVRVGVYGGSFDPPHSGHLILAADAARNLDLHRVLFVPASTQPFKPGKTGGASPEARLEMLRLAVKGQKSFAVDTVELDRGGLSYTVDTLEELSRRNAGAELFLIVGEDAARELDRWKNPVRIRELAKVAVLRRHPEGADTPLPEGFVEASRRLVDLSSTEIRERVQVGNSIRGFVSEAVEHYIEANALYR